MIGLLTILGFSLYDTVVVFDKVRENTRGLLKLTRRSYPEAANLALNQTLMRSMNTSLIAVLPVLGLLVIGVGLLGVGTLADLALVQLVGMVAGARVVAVAGHPAAGGPQDARQALRGPGEAGLAPGAARAAAIRAGEVDPDEEPAELAGERRRRDRRTGRRARRTAPGCPADRQVRSRPTGKRRR